MVTDRQDSDTQIELGDTVYLRSGEILTVSYIGTNLVYMSTDHGMHVVNRGDLEKRLQNQEILTNSGVYSLYYPDLLEVDAIYGASLAHGLIRIIAIDPSGTIEGEVNVDPLSWIGGSSFRVRWSSDGTPEPGSHPSAPNITPSWVRVTTGESLQNIHDKRGTRSSLTVGWLGDSHPVPVECTHEWVATLGFSRTYYDCSRCGRKKEDCT